MKKIVFVTGTRADYGKIKSIIQLIQKIDSFETYLFVTGMHNLKLFGNTYDEILKDNIKNVYIFNNQISNEMDLILAKTIFGFNNYIKKIKPDLVVVHGDRIETLACAISANLQLIKVAHIEGGELTGTIDEIIRHSVSKLSQVHFVTNLVAKKRLVQMGEISNNIFIIGSPDVDILLKKELPNECQLKLRYGIDFKEYAVCIFHPVVTEQKKIQKNAKVLFKCISKSQKNFVIIYPNNDLGYKEIIKNIIKLKKLKNIKILPSMRFEYYLSLLKNSRFIIGNSSSGIVEAPYYGVPTLNLGNRQYKRANIRSIINIKFNEADILNNMNFYFNKKHRFKKIFYFGNGNSDKKFMNIIKKKSFWNILNQKNFVEIN
jgi:UDP-N-acetylglucosamine 2-epimerase (hydrolysing)